MSSETAFFTFAIYSRVFAANDSEIFPERRTRRGTWRFAFRKRYLPCRKFTSQCSVLFFPAVKLGGIRGSDSERGKLGARTSAKFARQFVQLCRF